MAAFGLVPDDPKQALRIRRFFLAAGSTVLVLALMFAGVEFGFVQAEGAWRAAAAAVLLLVFVYGVLRSGLNLRFRDPSLTFAMCAAAILVIAYMLHHAESARGMGLVLYVVAMTFGIFRLDTRRMLALAALALGAHGAGLWAAGVRSVNSAQALELGQLVVLAAILPWFALVGGYASRLRARLADSNRELREALARIEQIAIRDELTGAYNRRFLIETLQREVSRAARLGTRLSVCLFDLDRFKDVNDCYGHAAGDAVIKRFTEIASTGLRGVDVLGRHGGEEFLLILPDTDLEGALGLAERIRANAEREDFAGVPASHRVTVTGGVACAESGETVDALLARADRALYRGKEAGRNRVLAG